MNAKLGAIFYTLWALLHFKAAHAVYSLAATLDAGMIQARLFQDASFMALVSALTIWVAITRNWNNDRTGYWVNLVSVSAVDVFFIILIVMPGYLPLKIALAGPVLWALALAFSTLAIRQKSAVQLGQ